MKYIVHITETHVFEILINANSQSEAIEKAKKLYSDTSEEEEYIYNFGASATSLKKTTFKTVKGKQVMYRWDVIESEGEG